ncbi:MAG: penicillin-binding protein 1C [Proteobacteria bacterium]|nr:penicillin-binding protein 1C [Pseudomonadota bacterium]
MTQGLFARKKGLVFLLPAGGVFFALLVLLTLDRAFPLKLSHRPAATLVAASDGTPLRAFADDAGVWRYPVGTDQVSSLYLQALLTYEDRFFYYHPGVNPLSMVRALWQNLTQGRVVSGGSTLTMQTARILYPNARTLGGKLGQVFRAFQLEFHYTKNEILGFYLTYAPFGANIEGVRTASHSWLGKNPMELTHAEAALLAVLPQAPSRFRPDRHPDRARRARNKVLDRLARYKVWSEQVAGAARQEPVVAFRFQSPLVAPLASRRLRSESPATALIRSCLDYDFQVHVADLLGSYITSLPEEQSGAVLVVNHKTMAVAAYAGSADFSSQKRKGHVDMVQALRSPGSALKPFLYGLAIDEGLIHSHSLLLDTPRYGNAYDPGNFSGGFAGPVTVAEALQNSLNIPAVQVLEAYGPQQFHDRLKHAGARLKLPGTPNPSMILGGVGTNLESLVTLYTALARDGQAARPRLKQTDPVQERYLMSPGAAYIIRRILSRPLPGQEGISRLSGGYSAAWKTGTSYGFRDAWAMGIKGDFVAGVWVGRPDGSPSPGQYGAITAVPLLGRVLESLPMSGAGNGSGPCPMPETIEQQTICWPSGISESQMPGSCMVRHRAWILDHQIPPTLTQPLGEGSSKAFSLVQTFWVDPAGNRAGPLCGGIKKVSLALWPRAAEPWLPAKWRQNRRIPPASDQCTDLAPLTDSGLQIVSIFDNSLLTRPPGHEKAPMIPLRTLGGQGRHYWFLNARPLDNMDKKNQANEKFMPLPEPGTYQLAVMDEAGNSDMKTFRVIETGPGVFIP